MMRRALVVAPFFLAGGASFLVGCWSGGHSRERVKVGLDLWGIPLFTAVEVEHESASVDAVRAGARVSPRGGALDGMLAGGGGSTGWG